MKNILEKSSIEWAIDSVAMHSDGDLFPKILEMDAIRSRKATLVDSLLKKDLKELPPGPSRRFIVPKDEISYRQATQLDPQDSIIFSALLYQFGQGIEDRRLSKKLVFSYRFGPTDEHGLYASQSAWNEFWQEAKTLALSSSTVLCCDIADFYNQIYHHTIENQLIASGFPDQATEWIRELLQSTTVGVSRGIPIGPHASHLIAEATLIPIDNALSTQGFRFLRFADDILIFCESKEKAKLALARLATTLDKQQRIILQRHKTQFLDQNECCELCDRMVEDRPINSNEKEMLAIVKKYSQGNPYKSISYEKIEAQDWAILTEEKISSIIQEYIDQQSTNYIRLRWFYRRLAQIGHPGAVRISLKKMNDLGPCFANICSYLASVQNVAPQDWQEIGKDLLGLLEIDNVKENEFFRLSILSLFAKNAHLNCFAALSAAFSSSAPSARREILLAAYTNGAADWIREYKESYNAMDNWQKRAFVFCCSQFPDDERKYFLKRQTFDRPFEATLCEWAKNCE